MGGGPSGQGRQRERERQGSQMNRRFISYVSGRLQSQEPHKSLLDILTLF